MSIKYTGYKDKIITNKDNPFLNKIPFMFTINIKGKRNPKNPEFVKLVIIFYKPGYARIPKIICISGLYKYWDAETQRFQSGYTEAVMKNKSLQKIQLKYLKVAEKWELENKAWLPVELSHYYDESKQDSDKYNKFLKKACLNLSISKKVTWSCARSGFISKMIDEGYHPSQVAELAGNCPRTIYKYYYTNSDKEKVREHMNEIL
ncbi:MAG: hypothetical protein ACLVKO_08195 [Dysgonomonas sp.]